MGNQKLIFVYNSDSSFVARALDVAHKAIDPDSYQCKLCALTYNTVTMKKEWRNFIKSLPIKVVFLHRDKFVTKHPERKDATFPAAFHDMDGRLIAVLGPSDFDSIESITELRQLLIAHGFVPE